MSNLELVIPIRYISTDVSEPIFRNELILHSNRFVECPSVPRLVYAIEKKLSRSNMIRKARILVPLCLALLCSDLYSVNSAVFKDIDDSTIEICWEYVELISISVDLELQEWMKGCINGRRCTEYSLLHCFKDESKSSDVVHVPRNITQKHSDFKPVDMSSMGINKSIWHEDDVEAETMIAHIKLVCKCSSSTISASEFTNLEE